jgi:hypothetical protein
MIVGHVAAIALQSLKISRFASVKPNRGNRRSVNFIAVRKFNRGASSNQWRATLIYGTFLKCKAPAAVGKLVVVVSASGFDYVHEVS